MDDAGLIVVLNSAPLVDDSIFVVVGVVAAFEAVAGGGAIGRPGGDTRRRATDVGAVVVVVESTSDLADAVTAALAVEAIAVPSVGSVGSVGPLEVGGRCSEVGHVERAGLQGTLCLCRVIW